MIHIATIHFNTARWIPVQARELKRHMTLPYVTWASFEGVDGSYRSYFDHVAEESGPHPEKLNRLGEKIARHAADDDLLMFLDGDAFPVCDPSPLLESGLASAPLLAVRRDENGGDPQPHPCFCVTEVATWRDLPGDWERGPVWSGPEGTPGRDVGGMLLRQLDRTGTPWTPVLRSNRNNPHPLFFGIYGDTIYHHGAGFRAPLSRADWEHLRAMGVADGDNAWQDVVRRNWHESEAVFTRIQGDEPDWPAEFR